MLAFIAIIIFGLGFASFATQNTSEIVVRAGNLVLPIPIYILAFGALLVGVLISEIIHLTKSATAASLIRQKNERIREDQEIINNLSEKIRDLESKNDRLQEKNKEEVTREDGIDHENSLGNFFDRFHL